MSSKLASFIILFSVGLFMQVSISQADPVSIDTLQQADNRIHTDAALSQKKVDAYFDQTQNLAAQYRSLQDEQQSLQAYNDYIEVLIKDQQQSINALKYDINSVDTLRQNIVPLMFNMLDALAQFVALDLPFNLDVRQMRIKQLKETLNSADVTLAEKYRMILDAYRIEQAYGNSINMTTGRLTVNGKDRLVNYLNVGRVALYAQSLDHQLAWIYHAKTKSWQPLNSSENRYISKAIQQAKGQVSPDMIKLMIPTVSAKGLN